MINSLPHWITNETSKCECSILQRRGNNAQSSQIILGPRLVCIRRGTSRSFGTSTGCPWPASRCKVDFAEFKKCFNFYQKSYLKKVAHWRVPKFRSMKVFPSHMSSSYPLPFPGHSGIARCLWNASKNILRIWEIHYIHDSPPCIFKPGFRFVLLCVCLNIWRVHKELPGLLFSCAMV